MATSINNPLSQKLFITSFLETPCILEEEAQSLIQHCILADNPSSQENEPELNLEAFVTQCNRSLDYLDLSIMRISHPNRDQHYFILTNFKHDHIAKLATNTKPPILETFKKVVQLILQSSNGMIPSTSILNSISSSSISKSLFEKTILKQWEEEYWLEEIDEGFYTLGIRAIHELKDYLKEEFQESRCCPLCEKVVLMPSSCLCKKTFYHRTCLKTTLIRNEVICSECNRKLTQPN